MTKFIALTIFFTPILLKATGPTNCETAEAKLRWVPVSFSISIGSGGVRISENTGAQSIPNRKSFNWRFEVYRNWRGKFPAAFDGDTEKNRPTADKLDYVLSRGAVPPENIKDATALRNWIDGNYKAEQVLAAAEENFPGAYGDLWLGTEWLEKQLKYAVEHGEINTKSELPSGIDGADYREWLSAKYINSLFKHRLEESRKADMFKALQSVYSQSNSLGANPPSQERTFGAVADMAALVDGLSYARRTQELLPTWRERLQYNLTKHTSSKGAIAEEQPEEIARQRARIALAEKTLRTSPWAQLLNEESRWGSSSANARIRKDIAEKYGLSSNYVDWLWHVFDASEGAGRVSVVVDQSLPLYGAKYNGFSWEDFFKKQSQKEK